VNSKQAARYYQLVEVIAPAIVTQSSLEIAGKIAALRKETLGKAVEQGLRPGNPSYDQAMSEFIRLSHLKVEDEVKRCGGTVATFAKAILDQTGRMVAIHRKHQPSP
jgi:hypothetical protein